MSVLKTLWNKITSNFHKSDGWKSDGTTMTRERPATQPPVPKAPYSETIDGVVYVTKENAMRLISDGANTPPSEELKEAVRSAMVGEIFGERHKILSKELTDGGLDADDVQNMVGTKKTAQSLSQNPQELTDFTEAGQRAPESSPYRLGNTDSESIEKLEKAKASMKAQIPARQNSRAQSLKKKKKKTSGSKKRKK